MLRFDFHSCWRWFFDCLDFSFGVNEGADEFSEAFGRDENLRQIVAHKNINANALLIFD